MRATLVKSTLIALSCSSLLSQPLAPSFEVASIKPARPEASVPVCLIPCADEHLTARGNRMDIRSISLSQLIVKAFRVKPFQLSGPNWMGSQKFDIVATMPSGLSKEQIPDMLQALLAERFKLSVHRESKEHSVYALVIGKNGSKLKTSTVSADDPANGKTAGQTMNTAFGDARSGDNGVWRVREGPYGQVRIRKGPMGTTHVEFLKITMRGLAEALTPSLDRVVVDATRLNGNYQIEIDWIVPPPPLAPGAAGSPLPAPRPALSFESIERAGLKLETRKGPVDMVIVDRLEKTPTIN